MNFEKNEFVFGIHEIFAIILKRIKLIVCFVVLAVGLNLGNYFFKNNTTYSDSVLMYTDYSFTDSILSKEVYETEMGYYKLQIRNLKNSLSNDENYYEKLIARIEVNKANEKLTFTTPSYKHLKKSLIFVYDEETSYFCFQIKYNCSNKNECYAVMKSAIEETIEFAPTIDTKLSVKYSTIGASYGIDNIIVNKSGFSLSKLSIVVLAFGFVLAFALELFSKKVKYTYVVENVVHPNCMITMDGFKNKGDK